MAKVLGCGAAKLPLKYLGVPVGGHLSLIKAVLGTKKMACMRWNSCMASKQKGGLGIRSIHALNVGLLFKWLWRFLSQSLDLWNSVIKEIHRYHRVIFYPSSYSSCLSPWSAILSFIKSLKKKGIDLLSLCSRKLRNGDSIHFLMMPPRGGIESFQLFDLKLLVGSVVLSEHRDSWLWSLDVSKGFSVASVQSMMDSYTPDVGPLATRWKKNVPIKVNIFLWRLTLNKLPFRMNLDRKGIDVDSLLCPTCQEDVEMVNHIFFNYDLAKQLWALLARWWDLDFPFCENISEWNSWLDSSSLSYKARLFLDGVGGTLMWNIWSFRLLVPYFLPTNDLLERINKALAFMCTTFALTYPSNNTQLETSSNPVNQVDMQGRQTQSYVGDFSNGNDHIARQCTQPTKVQNSAGFKEKMLLAQVEEAGIALSKEQLAIFADTRDIVDSLLGAYSLTTNPIFQSDGIDLYDLDCDEVPTEQASFIANISSYGLDVFYEVSHSDTYQNDMDNQSVQALPYFEQTPVDAYPDNEITSDSNIISYSQYLLETQQAAVQDTNSSAQQDSMILSVIEQISEQMINHCFVDKKLFEIKKKKLNLDNERLLEHIICQDVVNIVMHADVKYVNVLPMQNTFLDDSIALNVLKIENDRLMKLLASQDLVHTAVNSLFIINDYQLVQNPVSPTPYVSPSKKDYEILFQPLFDEYFSPLPCTISLDPVVVTAPRPVNLVVSPSLTAINQDVPSASSSPKNQEIQSQVIHQGVE
nr:hypothetical protein [Tanacetum cinerariifolium]